MCQVIFRVCPTIFGEGIYRRLHIKFDIQQCKAKRKDRQSLICYVWNFETGEPWPQSSTSDSSPDSSACEKGLTITWGEIQPNFVHSDRVELPSNEKSDASVQSCDNCEECTKYEEKILSDKDIPCIGEPDPDPTLYWVRWDALKDYIKDGLRTRGRLAKEVFGLQHQPDIWDFPSFSHRARDCYGLSAPISHPLLLS